MPTSTEKVFGVPELIETILLHFDYKQLFAIERVSHDFRDALQTSKRLRRTMFLEPARADNSKDNRTIILNPLLKDQTLRILPHNVHFPFTCISNDIVHITCERQTTQPPPNPTEAREQSTTNSLQPSWRRMRLTGNSSVLVVTAGFGFQPRQSIKYKNLVIDGSIRLDGQSCLGDLADWLARVPHEAVKKRELRGNGRHEDGASRPSAGQQDDEVIFIRDVVVLD